MKDRKRTMVWNEVAAETEQGRDKEMKIRQKKNGEMHKTRTRK